MWSNCYLFAVRRYRGVRGGHIVLSRSHYGWWWHARYTVDFRLWEEFVPLYPRRRWVPPLLYRGRVKLIRREPVERTREI